jgi:hypothetical protein
MYVTIVTNDFFIKISSLSSFPPRGRREEGKAASKNKNRRRGEAKLHEAAPFVIGLEMMTIHFWIASDKLKMLL